MADRRKAVERLHEEMFAGTSRRGYNESLDDLLDAFERGASEQEIDELFTRYQEEAIDLAEAMGAQYAEQVEQEFAGFSAPENRIEESSPAVNNPVIQNEPIPAVNNPVIQNNPVPAVNNPVIQNNPVPAVKNPVIQNEPIPAVNNPVIENNPVPAFNSPEMQNGPIPAPPAQEIPVDRLYTDTHRILYYEQQQKYAMEDLRTEEITDIGVTNNPAAADAYISIIHAQRKLNQQSLSNGINRINSDPQAAQNIIRHYEQRVKQRDAYITDVRRQQYTTQPLAELPEVDIDALQRRSMGHGQADWGQINSGVDNYISQGGDPANGNAMRAHMLRQGYPEAEQKWAASLADDPIRIHANGEIINGRHRIAAMRAQGIDSTLIQDQGRVVYDQDWDRKIIAGESVMAPQVDLMRSIQNRVYPNESAAIVAVGQQAGAYSSPAHDINYLYASGEQVRIGATELDDGRAVVFATNLSNQQTMVLTQYQTIEEAYSAAPKITIEELKQNENYNQLRFTPAELEEAAQFQQSVEQLRAEFRSIEPNKVDNTEQQQQPITQPGSISDAQRAALSAQAPIVNRSGHPRPNLNDPAERARMLAEYEARQRQNINDPRLEQRSSFDF